MTTNWKELPRVTAPILWVHDYYDGPLSGAVLLSRETVNEYLDPLSTEGRLCWFATIGDYPKRRHFLYDLEDWEIAKIVARHFLFEMYVGTHHCNHSLGPVKDRELHHLFYDSREPPLNVTAGKRPFAKFIRNHRKG